MRDASAEPQTVGVVMDGRRALPRVVRIVAELLAATLRQRLQEVAASRLG